MTFNPSLLPAVTRNDAPTPTAKMLLIQRLCRKWGPRHPNVRGILAEYESWDPAQRAAFEDVIAVEAVHTEDAVEARNTRFADKLDAFFQPDETLEKISFLQQLNTTCKCRHADFQHTSDGCTAQVRNRKNGWMTCPCDRMHPQLYVSPAEAESDGYWEPWPQYLRGLNERYVHLATIPAPAPPRHRFCRHCERPVKHIKGVGWAHTTPLSDIRTLFCKNPSVEIR